MLHPAVGFHTFVHGQLDDNEKKAPDEDVFLARETLMTSSALSLGEKWTAHSVSIRKSKSA